MFNKLSRQKLVAVLLLTLTVPVLLTASPAYQSLRTAKRNQPRAIIFNNDGCEINKGYYPDGKFTIERFLELRTAPLTSTGVKTICYCTITAGFSNCSHNSKLGSVLSDHPDFGNSLTAMRKAGTDPLREVIKYAHANGLEVFWSQRINDARHDQAYRKGNDPVKKLFPPLKLKHPEYLMGDYLSKRPPFGFWSAVDYTHPEIRKLCVTFFKEIVDNYAVDGVEIDFGRDPVLFKSVTRGKTASSEERRMLTEMLREINKNAAVAGEKRRRPILIAIRVPDSLGYCRDCGIDLDAWLKEGLVDILIGGSELHLNPWTYWAGLGKKYPGVRTYANMTDAWLPAKQHMLLSRNRNIMSFRAQAAAALQQGVDGIYSYNEYYPGAPHAKYLKEIDKAQELKKRNKLYAFTYSHSYPSRYLNDGQKYQNLPLLTPSSPLAVYSGGVELPLFIGDEAPGAIATLLLDGNFTADNIAVQFNGTRLKNGKEAAGLTVFEVPEKLLKPGLNKVKFQPSSIRSKTLLLKGNEILRYGENQGLWRRLFPGGNPAEDEKIVGESYWLRDSSTTEVYNFVYPWQASPKCKTAIQFEAQFVSGDDPDAVCVRVANGKHCEYLQIEQNQIGLKYANRKYRIATTDKFHSYKLSLDRNKIEVSFDGKVVLSASLNKPYTVDNKIIHGKSGVKTDFLDRNSVLFGSLSVQGTGTAKWKNIFLQRPALELKDAALLLVHDPSAPEMAKYRRYLNPPLMQMFSKQLSHPGKLLINYQASSGVLPQKPWEPVNLNAKNCIISDKMLIMDNQIAGAHFTRSLPTDLKHDLLRINCKFKVLDPKVHGAQFNIVVVINSGGQNLLWGFRFARNNVRNLDAHSTGLPAAVKKQQIQHVRILIDPHNGFAELYMDGSGKPVLREMGLPVKISPRVSFGDGSVAVTGKAAVSDFTVERIAVPEDEER